MSSYIKSTCLENVSKAVSTFAFFLLGNTYCHVAVPAWEEARNIETKASHDSSYAGGRGIGIGT